MIDGIHGTWPAGAAAAGTAVFAWFMLFFTADESRAVYRPGWLVPMGAALGQRWMGRMVGPVHAVLRLITCLAWLLVLAGAASSTFAILFPDVGTPGPLSPDEQNDLGAFFRTLAGPVIACQAAGNTWRIVLQREGSPDVQDRGKPPG